MQIKDMFQKDIDRQINGVIKVGQADQENIFQELDEYVVTKEINNHLGKFYENYLKSVDGNTDKMGVWISGFFGSGKSHFLKILAYLLENKILDNKEALSFFEDKIEDIVLYNDIKRAGRVDTEVILFNIDSKAPIGGKSQDETLLKIFLKVFNNHRGFYGDNPGIAEMERYLTQEGKYEKFKEEFKALKGYEWVVRRRTFGFDRDQIVGALTKATGMSKEAALEWYTKDVRNFEMDIETFAQEVKRYIDSKGPNFHLIFLVDEAGQFIGNDSTLMLNLQTIAEDLGTYCNGKAWVIVTSQEAIDEVSKNIKGNDFSKIQGRFDTKLSLSSISVDEVIKKRILEKQDFVNERLKQIYFEKSAILKNLITFRDATGEFRPYNNEDEFAAVYPFIPYQFKLLQNVFEQVRKRGSSGKHLSEGERSMLSAFKESAIKHKNDEEGVLIPFHAFYDTIKEFLNPVITRVIDGAYENPNIKDDKFNVDLLKVLFMVKYIKELPANVDNLATLMITNINEDKLLLKEKIIKSLNHLKKETLIEKNGEIYIFLTDDEQDINREIKQIRVDENLLKREIGTYMFEHFYTDKKYRHSKSYDFNFNKKMDEKDYGPQTSNIGINVLSPLSDNYRVPEDNLKMMTSGTGELILKLSENNTYIEELEEVLKINEYTKTLNMKELPENIQNIINAKKSEEKTRRDRAKDSMEDALKNAHFYTNGERIEISGSSVKEKVNNGLKVITETVYSKLYYIKSFMNKNEDILAILNNDVEQLSLDMPINKGNDLAINEILEYLSMQHNQKVQIRVKTILERFNNKPYGWNEVDISGILATLLMDQKINLRYNGEYLEPASPNIVVALTKPSEVDKVVITPRIEVDPKLIQSAKNICKDLWGKMDISNDEDGLAKDIKDLISKQIIEINNYLNRYEGRKYPGKSLLNKGLEYFEDFEFVLENEKLFAKLVELEENLLLWEDDMSYVKSFFDNQKEIFDKGLSASQMYKENIDYLYDEDVKEAFSNLTAVLEDYLPYGKIKDIPEYLKIINKGMDKILSRKKEETYEQLSKDFEAINDFFNQEGVSDKTKDSIIMTYSALRDNVENMTEILKIEGANQRSQSLRKTYEYNINKEIKEYWDKISGGDKPVDPPKIIRKVKIKELSEIKSIESQQDIEKLINDISKKLQQMLNDNQNIEFID